MPSSSSTAIPTVSVDARFDSDATIDDGIDVGIDAGIDVGIDAGIDSWSELIDVWNWFIIGIDWCLELKHI